jgi:hypothetical protein
MAVYAKLHQYLFVNFIEPTTLSKMTLFGWLGINPRNLSAAMVFLVVVKMVYKKCKNRSE